MTRERLLHVGLLAVLLVPLVFGKNLLYPFVVYRTYFFYILVDVLFILFLLEYGFRWVQPLWKNGVARAALVLLGVKLLTDLVGVHPWVSMWGNYERMMGFATHAHLLFFFIMAIVVFREPQAYRKLLDALVFIAGAVALYGILTPHPADERLFSTIGNPAFLAGFLLFGVFLGAWRAYEEKIQWRRILLLLSSLLSLIALYQTATRGAMIGLLAGAFIGGLWIAIRKKTFRVPVLVAIALLALGAAALLTGRESALVQESVTLRRLASLSLQDFSVQSRLLVWNMAWQGIKERPVFGYGENNVSAPLDRHMDPNVMETWFDSSHNVFMDTLLAHGFVGFVFFALLLTSVLRLLLYRRHEEPVMSAAVGAAILAYLVQAVFIFDTLVALLPLWLMFGFVAVHAPPSGLAQALRRREKVFVWAVSALLAVLLVSYIRPIRALAALSDGRFEEGLALATFGWGNMATVIRDATLRQPQAFQTLKPVLDRAYETARQKEGELSPYFGDLAQVYLAAPRPLRAAFAPAAEDLLNRAMTLSPGRVDLYFAKAQAVYEQGDAEGAKTLLQEIQTRFPAHVERAEGVLDQLQKIIDAHT